MNKRVTAFLIFTGDNEIPAVAGLLAGNKNVESIVFVSGGGENNFSSTAAVRELALQADTDFALIQLVAGELNIEPGMVDKMIETADEISAGIIYSGYFHESAGKAIQHPTIDYQTGSIRDDFNFGPFVLVNSKALKRAAENLPEYNYAGFYALRLAISRHHPVRRIPEFLYTYSVKIEKANVEKQFRYVDPKNREAQVEMEKAVTEHLKKIDAFLNPVHEEINFDSFRNGIEASVIIPVKNRAKTIADAVNSALRQKTSFDFNVLVIDNHSADGTTGILDEIASGDARLVHIIPESEDLGIGGCWNEAIFHEKCGKFAVQLDSDDLYKDENTLQKIVDKFYAEKCGMVIGSYLLTDFNLNELPPGIVDHREWTDENGHNNALRINGLGAPRAFYTPLIRKIKFPDVSYGEDYAAALAVSRKYKIGRIYNPVYICRRWEGNTDSSLTVEQANKNNFYKDGIRTKEIEERQKRNM